MFVFKRTSYTYIHFKETWIAFPSDKLQIIRLYIRADSSFSKLLQSLARRTHLPKTWTRERALINGIIVFWWGNKGTQYWLPPVMEMGPLSTLNQIMSTDGNLILVSYLIFFFLPQKSGKVYTYVFTHISVTV